MKLQQIVEGNDSTQFTLIMKALQTLGLDKSLKIRTKHMDEQSVKAAVSAIKNNVTRGYWNYVGMAANAVKIGGDLSSLQWGLSSMERVNSAELPYIKNITKEIVSIYSKMENLRGLLKGMEATHLCLQEIAKFVQSSTERSFEKTVAKAVLKKLGVAEFYGVRDEA